MSATRNLKKKKKECGDKAVATTIIAPSGDKLPVYNPTLPFPRSPSLLRRHLFAAAAAAQLLLPCLIQARGLMLLDMLNLFCLRNLLWGLGADNQQKVVLNAPEVASLRTEIANLEERESQLKAKLEHLDEILRNAQLSGYLYLRRRWASLPGEPTIDDCDEVDDWFPRFLVLHKSCVYLYISSSDLSPQDSMTLSDDVEVGLLPNITQETEGVRYCFYILTRNGLRYECSSFSKLRVNCWLAALGEECKLTSGFEVLAKSKETW